MLKNNKMMPLFCVAGIVALYVVGVQVCNINGGCKEAQMKKLTVTSKSFNDGERMPDKHAWKKGNVSPHLSWDGVPDGTKSIALICDDPDAQSVAGKTWVHWVLFNLPPETTELQAGMGDDDELDNGARQGENDFNEHGFGGPWPPEGHGVHHYHVKVYALDEKLTLSAGATKQQLEAAMKGHVLSEGKIVGTYSREK